MKQYDGQERRKHPRIEAQYILNFRKDDEPGYDVGHGQDLSLGGLLFRSQKAFVGGDELWLNLRFPFALGWTQACAQVVDCCEVYGGCFEVRAKFLRLDYPVCCRSGESVDAELIGAADVD